MLAGLTPCSVLLAARLVRGICNFEITASTFIPYTADRLDRVSVCIFTGMKFQRAYTKTEAPLPTGFCLLSKTASFL